MITRDAIVVGAGSVGLPTAQSLAEAGLKVLVLDGHASAGQGQHKAAIGGVRATHSDPAKIHLCQDSLLVFRTWKERYGQDIGFKGGGYCFPAYREREENILKGILTTQRAAGLNIDWLGPEGIQHIVPGITPVGLRGGTYSPDDGQVSPLMAARAYEAVGRAAGAEYRYGAAVQEILVQGGRVMGVRTATDIYRAPVVIIAAGASARQVGAMAGVNLPVDPDSHEAGITAPVAPFLDPLVVDIRPGPEGKTSNFYFGQNSEGQIIFCYTPLVLFKGTNQESTSEFMPIIARRLIALLPRLANLQVRRVWRGLYPMSPDGLPIVDRVREIEGLYVCVGMCGQGFMLGPGVGHLMARMVLGQDTGLAPDVLQTLSLYRDFGRVAEVLK